MSVRIIFRYRRTLEQCEHNMNDLAGSVRLFGNNSTHAYTHKRAHKYAS